jgi:circadian clock protein KaiB
MGNGNSKPKWMFRLFISGKSPRSDQAIATLEEICQAHLEGDYHVEVVDVIQNPHMAVEENIVVTPTLLKDLPLPVRRIIGDLTAKEKVISYLEIKKLG